MESKLILLLGGSAHMRQERINADSTYYQHAKCIQEVETFSGETVAQEPFIEVEEYISLTNRIFVYEKLPKKDLDLIIERAFGLEKCLMLY